MSDNAASEADREALVRIRDRLYLSDDAKFVHLLAQGQLLPRLLLMTNCQTTRETSVLLQLIQYVLRRVKESEDARVAVDCASLFPLVDPTHLPFCCNFAMVFLELGMKSMQVASQTEYSSALVLAIARFPLFSNQSNALMHLLSQFTSQGLGTALSALDPLVQERIRVDIGDWFLDVALVRSDVSKAGTGSVLPGLSQQRLNRVLAKKDAISSAELRAVKLLIVTMKDGVIPLRFYLVVCAVLSCDGDPDISREACYRFNSFVDAFRQLSPAAQADLVTFVLNLCTARGGSDRTCLREEVAVVLLELMSKHFDVPLSSVSDIVASTVIESFAAGSSRSRRFQTKLLVFVEGTVRAGAGADARTVASFLPELKNVLNEYAVSLTALKDAHGQAIRQMIYRIYNTAVSRSDGRDEVFSVASLGGLFRLLDLEEGDALVDLYILLESLRKLFESSDVRSHLPAHSDDTLAASLKKCSDSDNPKRKLVAVLWAKAILGWDPFVLRLLLSSAEHSSEDVAKTCASALGSYMDWLVTLDAPQLSQAQASFSAFVSDSPQSLLVNASGLIPVTCVLFCRIVSVHLSLALRPFFPPLAVDLSIAANVWPAIGQLCVATSDIALSANLLQIAQDIPILDYLKRKQSLALDPVAKAFSDFLFLVTVTCVARGPTETLFPVSVLVSLLSCTVWHNADVLRRLSVCIGLHCLHADKTAVSSVVRVLSFKIKEPENETNFLVCYSCVIECLVLRLELNFDHDILSFLDEYACVVLSKLHRISQEPSSDSHDDQAIVFLQSLQYLASKGLFSFALPITDRVMRSSDQSLFPWCIGPSQSGASSFLDGVVSFCNTFINKSASKLSAESVELLSRIVCTGVPVASFTDAWATVSSDKVFFGEGIAYKFKVAESLVRMSLVSGQSHLDIAVRSSTFRVSSEFPLLGSVLYRLENVHTKTQKSSVAVLLLVLLKLPGILSYIEDPNQFLYKATQWFVQSLKEVDLFLQDVCCLGLCCLYAIAPSKKMSTLITDEVIVELTKEKPRVQPVGYAEAGQSTAAVAPVTEGAANATLPATIATGANATLAEAIRAAQATLASELGVFLENEAPQRVLDVGDSDRYGVYSTLCKIARKTGNSAVLFTVFGLIQRDPDFCSDSFRVYYDAYSTPAALLSDSELCKLIPILYMYKFEPVIAVKEVIIKLWTALVPKDSSKRLILTVESEIIKSLVGSLSSKSWRHREAACLALEHFLFSRSWDVIFKHLSLLWENGIRVIDDIRETTRKAALAFMKVLSESIVKACNPDDSEASRIEGTVDYIVPWLLNNGLLQSSQEALGFSFGLLLRIIKTARSYISKYRAKMIGALVESMSALEPQALQYLEFHTARLNISAGEYEANRLKLASESPMQEALDWCLKTLDPDAVPLVLLTLRESLQFGVGLSTKVAAAQSLCFIAENFAKYLSSTESLKVYTFLVHALVSNPPKLTSLLSVMYNCLKQYTKVVHPESIASACDDVCGAYYLSSGADEDSKLILANILLNVISGSADKDIGETSWKKILTVAYAGSFDYAEVVSDKFRKLFMEALLSSTLGTKISALRLIQFDAIAVCESMLQDLSWNKRSQGMSLFMDFMDAAPLAQILVDVSAVVRQLLLLLPGQIWTGQEKMFEAISAVANKFKDHIDCALPRSILFVNGTMVIPTSFATYSEDIHSGEALRHQGTDSWSLSARGLVGMLLKEAHRGTAQYKIAVSVALSTLPWQFIKETSSLLFLEFIVEWLDCAQIATDEVNVLSAKRDPKQLTTKKVQPRTAHEMFGSRYGMELKSKKLKPSVRVVDPPDASITPEVGDRADEDAAAPAEPEPVVVRTVALPEPAFRVKVLETIAKSWPSMGELVSNQGSSGAILATQTRLKLFDWCYSVVTSEVWSIRRVAYVVFGSLIADDSFSTEQYPRLVLVISSGVSDSKYSQIRKAALTCLVNILEKINPDVILLHKIEVRRLIVLGCSDSQSEVLEVASQAQKMFTELSI